MRSIRGWIASLGARLQLGRVPEISPAVLHAWLAEGRAVQLVDARSALEFQRGSLPGARHAPVSGLPQALEQLDLDERLPVVLLCLSGHRSRPGTRLLRARGLEAYSLQGGLLSWRQLGYPLTGSRRATIEE